MVARSWNMKLNFNVKNATASDTLSINVARQVFMTALVPNVKANNSEQSMKHTTLLAIFAPTIPTR